MRSSEWIEIMYLIQSDDGAEMFTKYMLANLVWLSGSCLLGQREVDYNF